MRILSLNIHKGTGWGGKSSLTQIYSEIRKIHPDLIFLQEICNEQYEFLADSDWPYVSYGMNARYTSGHHGNAILSKFPIHYSENIDISHGAYENRGLLHTIVQPSDSREPLHLICTHLGLFKRGRDRQFAKITEYIKRQTKEHCPLILAGDFNDWQSHATHPLVEKLGLREAFLHHHGEYAKTFPSIIPLFKLDRLYMRGFETCHAKRLDHTKWKLLSDHLGLDVHLKRV